MSNNIKKLGNIFLRPFKEHLLFFIAFFILATSAYFIWFFIYGQYYYSLNLLMHCLVISYIITLITGLIQNNITQKIIQVLVIGMSAILFCLNIYGIFELDSLIDEDYLMLILNTNINEAQEFASNMLPTRIILGLIVVFGLLLILWLISKKHPFRLGKKSSSVAMGLICLCAFKNLIGWGIWIDGPIQHLSNLYSSLSKYEFIDKSKLNHKLPAISINDTQQLPANVVFIIGESFARFHSSLYGYEKNTNPYLSSLRDQSLLFTFDSIDAPAPTTGPSLKYMLTTYSKDDSKNQSKKWYDYPTIIELMRSCGYDCYWFSNQARSGKFNYISRVFSELCDQNFFYQQEGSIRHNTRHDIVLADSSHLFIKKLNRQKHHFIVYHMMGSHFDYSMRYSSDFNHFSTHDYMKFPEHQREVLATYDNSILYNDYVVNEIIDIFKDEEAIIIYAPDHGQDMFRSSPNYRAHGKMNNPASYAYGVEIPFMIYATPLFQQNYPNTIKRIKNRQKNPKTWIADNMPYLIMDLIGVEKLDGESIQNKSVLN